MEKLHTDVRVKRVQANAHLMASWKRLVKIHCTLIEGSAFITILDNFSWIKTTNKYIKYFSKSDKSLFTDRMSKYKFKCLPYDSWVHECLVQSNSSHKSRSLTSVQSRVSINYFMCTHCCQFKFSLVLIKQKSFL